MTLITGPVCSKLGYDNPGLVQNLKFRNKSFKSNFSLILFIYILMTGCSKKGVKNFFSQKKAFEQEKKERRLKFNPGLVSIGLQTTGPSRSLPSPPTLLVDQTSYVPQFPGTRDFVLVRDPPSLSLAF